MSVTIAASVVGTVLGASAEISIVDFEYKPTSMTVAVGDPVTWSNGAADAHTVTSDTGTELDSGNIAAGESYGHVFETPGTYPYHCTIHPTQMKGTIVVQPAAPGPSGSGTPAPPVGTLPPNFSPGSAVGPVASAPVEATAAPTPSATASATTDPTRTSDGSLPLIVGLGVAILVGATIAYLLARGRPDRRR